MTSEMLLRAIGNIGDELIEGAEEPPVRSRVYSVNWVRWGALAASLVIVAGIAFAMPRMNRIKSAEYKNESETVTTEGAMETPEAAEEPASMWDAEYPAEDEALPEAAMEESSEEGEDSTNSANGDIPYIVTFTADSFELNRGSDSAKSGDNRAVDGLPEEFRIPDRMAGVLLKADGDGVYIYDSGAVQVRVTVEDTELTTLADGYLSDFYQNGQRMYITDDYVVWYGEFALCAGEVNGAVAAQSVVVNNGRSLLVSAVFPEGVSSDDAGIMMYEICTAVQGE